MRRTLLRATAVMALAWAWTSLALADALPKVRIVTNQGTIEAILYADKVTDSMNLAISETQRRRDKQIQFNLDNGITPRGVNKQVKELIDGVFDPNASKARKADKALEQAPVSEKNLSKEIKRLEKLMLEHAKNLEFEKAAQVRDQLGLLKEQMFGSRGDSNVTALDAKRA